MNFFTNTLFNSGKSVKKKTPERKFFLIAGPCVIESEKIVVEHAAILKDICNSLQIPLLFKASYDKANRTSIKSFRGPGLTKGLKILARVKKQLK